MAAGAVAGTGKSPAHTIEKPAASAAIGTCDSVVSGLVKHKGQQLLLEGVLEKS